MCVTEVSPGSPIPATTLMRKEVAQCSIEMYASRMRILFVLGAICVLLAGVTRAESPTYLVFVSNERSGDVTVIDGNTDAVVVTFSVGKRPRGIHATPDGKRLFVTLSGSPRMAPGLDENRAPADKRADGLAVIDPVARKLVDRWHVGWTLSNSQSVKMENSRSSRMKTTPALQLSISIQGNRAGK